MSGPDGGGVAAAEEEEERTDGFWTEGEDGERAQQGRERHGG